MIEYVQGNLLDDKATILVNPVNCVGVMGKGLAAQFKKQYPGMFLSYCNQCTDGKLYPGTLHWWFFNENDRKVTRWIVNFPTKITWQEQSKLEHIETGLRAFVRYIDMLFLNTPDVSAAWPKLGCGLGGLNWHDVKPLMILYLEPLQICSRIYE